MSELDVPFDATTVEPNAPFEVIPAGKYRVHAVASEMRPTKNGDGVVLWIEFDILDGEQAGRKLWDRINLKNLNPKAVEIGRRTLSALCHATGELSLRDSEQLHQKPIIATVRVRPQRTDDMGNTYAASNEIRGYQPEDGSRPAVAPAQPQQARPAPAASGSKTPPWRAHKS